MNNFEDNCISFHSPSVDILYQRLTPYSTSMFYNPREDILMQYISQTPYLFSQSIWGHTLSEINTIFYINVLQPMWGHIDAIYHSQTPYISFHSPCEDKVYQRVTPYSTSMFSNPCEDILMPYSTVKIQYPFFQSMQGHTSSVSNSKSYHDVLQPV